MKILRFKIFFHFLIISNSVGSNVEFEWVNSDRHWSVPWTQRSSERRSLWGRDSWFVFAYREIERYLQHSRVKRSTERQRLDFGEELIRCFYVNTGWAMSSVHNNCWVWASPKFEILDCSYRLLINVLIKFYGWFRWYLRTSLALNYKHWNHMYRIKKIFNIILGLNTEFNLNI